MKAKTIWTIGHSTRTIEAFLGLLFNNKIETLVDVRGMPGSRKFPQFNKETLSVTLEKTGIRYFHLAALGGRRKKTTDSKNTAWHNLSFRNYADYMETPEFEAGMQTLTATAQESRCCIMCSEAVWWRCHRSMISDYLKAKGWEVLHILSPGNVQEHPYTAVAHVVNGKLDYHGEDSTEG